MYPRLVSAKFVEEAKEQYQSFVKDVVTAEFDKFKGFDKYDQRVDEFLGTYLSEQKYCKVYDILKIVCTLSHGQSSIERGFSINKEHLVENLQEESLMALRVINDYMVINKFSPIDIPITKEMTENVKASRKRYMVSLEEQKNAGIQNEKTRKRKQLTVQVEEVAAKKKALLLSIEKDVKRSDKLALQAEAEKDFSVLHMSNSLKDLVKKKREELSGLTKEEQSLKEKSLR